MTFHFNFAQEWPVLILIGVFIWFVAYLMISGRKNQNKGNDSEKKK